MSRSTEQQTAPLTGPSRLRRLAGIGVILLSVAAAFLYLGGWFTPHALTPARFHTLIVRDGLFNRMAPWRVRAS